MKRQDLRVKVAEMLRNSADPQHRNMADWWIGRRWYYSGPGPVRFVWWAVSAAGATQFLGYSVSDIEKKVQA